MPRATGSPADVSIQLVITGTLGTNGWYTSNVTVNWVVTGAADSNGCDAKTLTTDTSGTTLTCTASDGLGSTVSNSHTFKIDKTPPAVTAAASRGADANGWYNHALSVTFSGTDTMSGMAGCSPAANYSGPDTASTSASGSCTDNAGNVGTASLPLKYDSTPPSATAVASRGADANGWYNHALSVTFSATDATSGVAACSPAANYNGPDNGSTSVNGSCTDNAGNVSPATLALKYDSTPPNATAAAGRGPDANGWYNHTLAVSFSGTDATSGIAGCTSTNYSGPDTASASVNGSCTDKAGNVGAANLQFNYDSTPPNTTAAPSRAADANGWYNHVLTVSFSGTDATSGLAACSPAVDYSGPDNAGAAANGSCTDKAGNVGAVSLALKYDSTPPTAASAAGRPADANGWYNHAVAVAFSGTDATSGIAGCSSSNYSGPDTASATVNGSCTDKAGNVAAASLPLKYDSTPPTTTAAAGRGPDDNGWYNHAVPVTFSGTDAMSGIAGCTSSSYSGPDAGGATVNGSCTDKAGNVGAAGLPLKYDSTPPNTTAAASRAADANGWYNHALTITFSGTDAMSGIAGCSPAAAYNGPDDAAVSVNGSCTDKAGNVGAAGLPLKYDSTPPAATAAASRAADANGWYNHALTVTFSGTDATSGIAGCSPAAAYNGPDNAGTSVNGSCTDKAGNASPAGLQLKYDSTPPSATAAAGRAADANGWYNHAVAVTFSGTDATSGIASCTSANYSGPDNTGATVNGSCTDKAGNVGTASLPLKYDSTPPSATAAAGRAADANGWYNHALTVTFSGADATSGIAGCSPAAAYNGPDDAGATVNGSCTDKAGNVGTASLPLKYDATFPTMTASPSQAANANGWYNQPFTVTFSGTDAVSGIAGCSPAVDYNGPDNADTTLSGSCTDNAGNIAFASLPIKYDSTPPTATAAAGRAADANGWYNHTLTVSFAGTDAMSGIAGCSSVDYSGPDSSSATVTGSCTDNAGNLGTASLPLKYDATPPKTTATPGRTPNANGWYNHALTVSFSGADATAGIAGCSPAVDYNGPDNAGTTLSGSCTDNAGNVGTASLPLKYDATPPTATAVANRAADANGWYNHALVVNFSGTDAISGITGCSTANYVGPDTSSATVTGSCTDKAGNVSAASLPFKYDATPPVTTATASRAADATGWYNHALTVTFSGTDATAGVAACSTVDYSGPNNPSATVTGFCTDNAGNIGTASLPLKYDATAPTLSKLTWERGNRTVELKWSASADTQSFQVTRAPGKAGAAKSTIYRGSAASYRDTGLTIGKEYAFTVTAYDEAGNTASATARITATGALLSPAPGARVSSPPLLVWTAVGKAHYYNLQLMRGKKILSVWPRQARFRVPRSWDFHGHHYRMSPGVYRWYVWPGFGHFAAAKYGRSIGGSWFVVVGKSGAAR